MLQTRRAGNRGKGGSDGAAASVTTLASRPAPRYPVSHVTRCPHIRDRDLADRRGARRSGDCQAVRGAVPAAARGWGAGRAGGVELADPASVVPGRAGVLVAGQGR